MTTGVAHSLSLSAFYLVRADTALTQLAWFPESSRLCGFITATMMISGLRGVVACRFVDWPRRQHSRLVPRSAINAQNFVSCRSRQYHFGDHTVDPNMISDGLAIRSLERPSVAAPCMTAIYYMLLDIQHEQLEYNQSNW